MLDTGEGIELNKKTVILAVVLVVSNILVFFTNVPSLIMSIVLPPQPVVLVVPETGVSAVRSYMPVIYSFQVSFDMCYFFCVRKTIKSIFIRTIITDC